MKKLKIGDEVVTEVDDSVANLLRRFDWKFEGSNTTSEEITTRTINRKGRTIKHRLKLNIKLSEIIGITTETE